MRRERGLANAFERAKRENKLTDLLALVLEMHVGFANRVLAAANLPGGAARVTTATERWVRDGFVDLTVKAWDASGLCVARLWSENKTGAEYQPDQLPRYAKALAALPEGPPSGLIAIVDHRSEIPTDYLQPQDPRWLGFTWNDVAGWAWEAGRAATAEADRAWWREVAALPDAPARQWLLQEFLSYLEERHGCMVEQLHPQDITTFASMGATRARLEGLFAFVAEISGASVTPARWVDDGFLMEFSAVGTWAAPLGGSPRLRADPSDAWRGGERLREPAFGAGYSVRAELADALLTAEWNEAVRAEQFDLHRIDVWVRVWRTKYLTELITAGMTLEAQAREVAEWAQTAFAVLARHDPAEFGAPATGGVKTA